MQGLQILFHQLVILRQVIIITAFTFHLLFLIYFSRQHVRKTFKHPQKLVLVLSSFMIHHGPYWIKTQGIANGEMWFLFSGF